MSLRVSLAGGVSIRGDGVLIDERRFPGRQGRLVFAYLVSEHDRPVLRDELAEVLWGDAPPATWEKALVGIVSKLRGLLGECGIDGASVLTSAFGCYRLALPEGTWVDIVAASRAVATAESALVAGSPETARTEAGFAASLAGLPLLPGEDGAWVQGKRRELADVRFRAIECLADACLRSGDASEAAKWAREAIELEPFRESGHRQLMHAHAAAGNRAEGLRAYERCRRLLAEELGAYPSPETEAIYRGLLSSPTDERTTVVPEAALRSPIAATSSGEPQRPRLPGRRILLGAALTGAALAGALGVLVARTSDSPADAVERADGVAVIDSRSGKVLSEVSTAAPGEVAAGRDAVWVTNESENSVSRIDPATGQVRQTIRVGRGPADVAVGGGAVWVANGLDGTVSRIDPKANEVVQTITVGNGPSGIAYGEGAVWVTNSADGTASQVDPADGEVTRTLPAAIGASGVAVGFGRVWIASPPSGSVVALDPRSGQVVQRVGVGVDPDAVTAGAGAVWIANRSDGTVSRVDPVAAAVTSTVRVARRPAGLAAGPDGVWVADEADATLSRIDPSSGSVVTTVRVGRSPRGVALSSDGVYVAVRSTGSHHRGGTLRVLVPFGVPSLDPALSPPNGWSVLTMTNDGLVGFRKVGGVEGAQLVPDLATALPTPTEGGRTYVFQVRPGVRYSTGGAVQPADFRRAIERLFEVGGNETDYYRGIVGADRCVAGRSCDLARGISSDRAARTVTFHLKAPDADFLAKLALPPAFAVPAGTPARELGTRPVPATGPYRIAAWRRGAKTVRLVRNPMFREWSADAQPDGYPDSILWSWRFPQDPSARVRTVERGAADVAVGGGPPLSKRRLDDLALRYADRLHTGTALSTTYFFLNTRVPPFDDVRVRRAVNTAFDRDAFARLLGRAVSPTCQILPPNFPGYRPACPDARGATERIDEARRLVRRSGTAGSRVTVWVPRPIADHGRFMVSVLESLGFRTRLALVEPDEYFERVSDSRVRAQTGYYSWFAAYPSAADFIPPQFSCAQLENGNFSALCDRAIDAQMARAAAAQTEDPAAATVLWQRVEQALLAQARVVPAYNRSNVDFVSKRLGNYQYHPQWGVLLDQAWVR